MNEQVLILGDRQIRSLNLSIDAVASCVRGIFREQADGSLRTFPRMPLGSLSEGRFIAFPALSAGTAGVKWLSIGHRQRDGSPSPMSAHILVSDAETGALQALVDARWITWVRTVAVSVVAAELLADPASESVGFIGCGQLARGHLEFLARAFPLRRVLAYGRNPAGTADFVSFAQSLGLRAEAADLRSCVEGSQILISSTSQTGGSPASSAWLANGAFVSLVDLGRNWQTEPAQQARYVVDDLAQYEALAASGQVMRAASAPSSLGTWLQAPVPAAERHLPTILLPTGCGAADLAIAAMLVQRAEEEQTGLRIDVA